MKKHALYVADKLTEREILEQLAEEAAELSQAALKMIRAKKLSCNPTPVSEVEAGFRLEEEMIDVVMCILLYGINPVWIVDQAEGSCKWERWAERIKSELEAKEKYAGVENEKQ